MYLSHIANFTISTVEAIMLSYYRAKQFQDDLYINKFASHLICNFSIHMLEAM